MASSQRAEAAGAADDPTAATTTTSASDGAALFAIDGDIDDDGSVPLMTSAGAFSPRANGSGPSSIPPPDEIQGPPRRPFRRRHGASPTRSSSSSSSAQHRHRAHDYPSESGGFGGRRNSLTASTSSSAQALSIGTKLLRIVLSNWDRALVLSALIAATVLVSTRGVETLKAALLWLQRHSGWAGWGIFLACYALAVSLLLPGVAAVLGAGFVFGFWRGLLAVWAGGAIGQVGAFLLSRYLLGGCVSGLLKGSRLWASIDAAVEVEGWKLLLILRLSPIIPYNLLNVAAAATKIHLVPFALASAAGILPECALLVYAGSLAESITAAVSGEATHKKITWILGGLTIAAGVAAGVAATLLVRRAVKRAAARADALAEAEEEEAEELARGGFLLSLDHETFDRNSFGGGGDAVGGSSSWLSPLPTAAATTTATLPTIPSAEAEGGGGGSGVGGGSSTSSSSAVPPQRQQQQKGSNGALIDV